MILALGGEGFAQIPAADPETVDFSPDRLVRIRAALQKEIDADRMPGAVVMIARRGQLIYSDAVGFQDKAAERPMPRMRSFEFTR
jgi:CubicO group peptidase (beta-lactamase class C family)